MCDLPDLLNDGNISGELFKMHGILRNNQFFPTKKTNKSLSKLYISLLYLCV